MANGKKKGIGWWIAGFVIIILGGVGYWKRETIQGWFAKKEEAKQIEEKPVEKSVEMVQDKKKPEQKTDFSKLPNGTLPLKKGDKNKLAYLLQVALNKVHNAGLKVDGEFGGNTEKALKSFYGGGIVDRPIAQRIFKDVSAIPNKTAEMNYMIQALEQYA